MAKESNLELKVGLFILLALVGLTIFIFSISDSSIFEEGKTLKVVFNFANGLKRSAPVRIAGVDEGIVKDLKLFFDPADNTTRVEVFVQIKKDSKISKDSVIFINQLGLMGEKYVEIIPGKDMQNFFEVGDTMVGKDPIAQEAIAEQVMMVSKKLESAIVGFDQVVHDEQNVASIKSTLNNLSQVTGNLQDILAHVKEGQGTVGKLFYNERMYNDLEALTADLKENPWKLLYRPKGIKK